MNPTWHDACGPRVRSRRLLPAAVGIAGALLLTGCAGQLTTSDQTAAGEPAAPAAAAAPGTTSYELGAVGDKAAGSGTPTVVPAGLDSPAVVVTGSATLRASDVPAATRTLTRLVGTYGGRVDDQSTSAGSGPGSGDATSVTTVRIPPARVTSFLDELPGIGSVASSEVTRADASAEVADVASRVGNARASVARVRALLERATKLADIVMLESEMSKRQSDLEALEARARVLADQTSLATLTVTVVAQDAIITPTEVETGFLAGLRGGWAAFTAAGVAALTVLGALTPFLVLVVVLGWVGLLLVRRRRDVTPPDPAPLEG